MISNLHSLNIPRPPTSPLIYLLFPPPQLDTSREDLSVLLLLSIKPVYTPTVSSSLPVQQTSCPSSLRLDLVLGLSLSYLPTLSFFISILFTPSILVYLISFWIRSFSMAWKHTPVFQIKERQASNPSPLSSFELATRLPFRANLSKHYLYCGRAGLLPHKCHVPLPTAESWWLPRQKRCFQAPSHLGMAMLLVLTNETGSKVVCNF